MGAYDMLPKGGLVKLWGSEMVTRKVGDVVPDFGLEEYVVFLREGGYVRVKDGIISEIRENSKFDFYPEDFPGIICFDKWGCEVRSHDDLIGELQGTMGMDDPYYFRSK